MDTALTELIKKWVIEASQSYSPEVKQAKLRCAMDLLKIIRDNHRETMENVDDLTAVVTDLSHAGKL